MLSLIMLLFLNGCNGSNGGENQKDLAPQQAFFYELPAEGKIKRTEKKRLHAKIDNWYNQYLKNSALNGAVLVAKNGTIIYEIYKGTNPLGSKTAIDLHTAFHVASVTKTFTAMAVLKLAEAGKLRLDDPFSKYFPEFNYEGVTIQTLLNHRSGLPNYLYFMERLWPDKKKFISNQDVLDYLIQKKDQLTNIGTPDRNFSYCNTNFALLALLLEKISGQTYPELMHTQIFEPLKMENSFVYTEADSARISPNYDWRGNEIPMNYLDNVYGDKNIYSTVRDMLKWDRLLISGNYLSDSMLQKAYTPYSNERPGIKNYGLGWRMDIFPNGKKMVFHNGWWHGNNASFVRLFDEDVCIIVLNNRYTRAVYKTKQLINVFADYFPDNSFVEESDHESSE